MEKKTEAKIDLTNHTLAEGCYVRLFSQLVRC